MAKGFDFEENEWSQFKENMKGLKELNIKKNIKWNCKQIK